MDSILWSSGLFAADAYQWKEIFSASWSWTSEAQTDSVTLSGNDSSVIVIYFYGGSKITSNTYYESATFRLSFKSIIDNFRSKNYYLPLRESNNYGQNEIDTNTAALSASSNSSVLVSFNRSGLMRSGAFTVCVFDPI